MDENDEPIPPRQETILRAIVFEYVSTAEPVGSETIAAKYPLGVKSATVRNEMGEMLERGLIEQPHASAGRIPSDIGYRYYVDRLRPEVATDRLARGEAGEFLDTLLRDALGALARTARLLAVASTVSDPGIVCRTVAVTALGPAQALVVLALSNGHVETRSVACPAQLTLEHIGRANEALAHAAVGRGLGELASLPAFEPRDGAEGDLLEGAAREIRDVAVKLRRGRVLVEGEAYLFAQPEFRGDAVALEETLASFLDGDELTRSLDPRAGEVTIGREHGRERLRRFSIVQRPFRAGGVPAGVIAIVGPTRMPYETTIPLVAGAAELVSTALARAFAD